MIRSLFAPILLLAPLLFCPPSQKVDTTIVETPETAALVPADLRTPELNALAAPAPFVHSCPEAPAPVKTDYSTLFDNATPPFSCEGTLDVGCVGVCKSAWSTATASARATANAAMVAAEGVRYRTELLAWNTYDSQVEVCETAYIYCLALSTSLYCEIDYCTCVAHPRATYDAAVNAAEATFAASVVSISAAFNAATVAANAAFLSCVAGCCH